MSLNHSNKYPECIKNNIPRGHSPQKDLSRACPPPSPNNMFAALEDLEEVEEERVETNLAKTHSNLKYGASIEIYVNSENTTPKFIKGTPCGVRIETP
jgi:hypothetical protein